MLWVAVVTDTATASAAPETSFLVGGLIGGGILLVVALAGLTCYMMQPRQKDSRDY